MRSWLLAVGLVAALTTPAPPCLAQATGPAAAKKHFDAAKKAYKAGAYQDAIRELDRAIELDPKGKDLFYNLGLVHEKLGELDKAIAAFKRYTELETDIADLEKAIQIQRRLEGARDELARKKAAEEQPKPEEPPRVIVVRERERDTRPAPAAKPEKGRLDAWVYASGGLALVGVGVGTYFGLQALSTDESSQTQTSATTSVSELQERKARAHDYAVISDVAFTVGALSAGAALVLYFTRDKQPSTPRVGVVLGPGSAALRGGF